MKNSIDHKEGNLESVSTDPRLEAKLKPVEREMAETDLQLRKKNSVLNDIDNTRSEFDVAGTDGVFSFQDIVTGEDWDTFFDMICGHEQNIGNHVHPEYKDVSGHLSYDQKNQIKVLMAGRKTSIQLEIDQLKVKKDILCEKHNAIMVEHDIITVKENEIKGDKLFSLDPDLRENFNCSMDAIGADDKYNTEEEFAEARENEMKTLLRQQISRDAEKTIEGIISVLSGTFNFSIEQQNVYTYGFKDISESFNIVNEQIAHLKKMPLDNEYFSHKKEFLKVYDSPVYSKKNTKRLVSDKMFELGLHYESHDFGNKNLFALKELMKTFAKDFSNLDENDMSSNQLLEKLEDFSNIDNLVENVRRSDDIKHLYRKNYSDKMEEFRGFIQSLPR